VVAGPATEITLIPCAGGPGRGILSGTVSPIAAGTIGALVVAEADRPIAGRPAGTAAWTDLNGNYTIFGLASGDHRVRAYVRGASSAERIMTIDAGETTARLDFHIDTSQTAATVTGTAPLTAGSGSPSLSLVVASTWDGKSGAGEEPVGLNVPVGANGSFSFTAVPAGHYLLVDRATDGYVAVDEPVAVDVESQSFNVPSPPRLVPAIAIVRPGAGGPEGVSGQPQLSWGDITGEDHYEVDVVNAAGLTVYTRSEPAHDGSSPVLTFDVPFVAGQLYRFRARAVDAGGHLLSKTEDRRGVFFFKE
jgi:hypothetical protein